MKSFGAIAGTSFGPLVFFREVMKIRRGVVQHWRWEEWDRFFALAEEHVIAVHAPADGAPIPDDAYLPAYPPLMRCLLTTWRSTREARAEGLTAAQWRNREGCRIEALADAQRELQEQYRQEQAAAQSRVGVIGKGTDPEYKARKL